MPNQPTSWREEILQLAKRYDNDGTTLENRAVEHEKTNRDTAAPLWMRAVAYREIATELRALVNRVDPRPGAGPW